MSDGWYDGDSFPGDCFGSPNHRPSKTLTPFPTLLALNSCYLITSKEKIPFPKKLQFRRFLL